MTRLANDAAGVLWTEIKWSGLPPPEREYRFHAERRWRFDMAWPDKMLALEVDGGGFIAGRHTRGKGFEADCEKQSIAAAMGWRVMHVTPDQIHDGKAIAWVLMAFRYGP